MIDYLLYAIFLGMVYIITLELPPYLRKKKISDKYSMLICAGAALVPPIYAFFLMIRTHPDTLFEPIIAALGMYISILLLVLYQLLPEGQNQKQKENNHP